MGIAHPVQSERGCSVRSRRLLIIAATFVAAANAACAAEEPKSLNTLLDERIEKNEAYRDEFAKAATESPVADVLVPAEHNVGQRWIDMLTYARQSTDMKLKAHLLRLDYSEEVRATAYDLEYAEGLIEKGKVRIQLAHWNLRLHLVDRSEKAALGADEVSPEAKVGE